MARLTPEALSATLGIVTQSHHSWDQAKVTAIIGDLKDRPSPLLLVLRRIQDELGWVPAEAVPLIASALRLSRAEVHGVISFYHDFKHAPPGRNIIKLCRAESCQALGAVALADYVKNRLGIDFGQTTSDRNFTLEAVYCLGNCACSPAAVVNGELVGRATIERLNQAISDLEATRP
ncbi:MAG TPA: formate dehydrogenase subunit gamma [Candidatus Binataceae bacterium]|nr:formate dehydrogenase subunit gamma [Candidatus Binataceae bacterium]